MKNPWFLIIATLLLSLLGGCKSNESQNGQGESFEQFLSRFPKLTTPCKVGEGQKIGFSINYEEEEENDLMPLFPNLMRQIPSCSETSYDFNVFPIAQITGDVGFKTVIIEQVQWEVPAMGSGISLITFSPAGKFISEELVWEYMGDENLMMEFMTPTTVKISCLSIGRPDMLSEVEGTRKLDTIPFVEHLNIGEDGTITSENQNN